jgi:hypothetical protein
MAEQTIPPAQAAAFAELTEATAAQQAYFNGLSLSQLAANQVTVYPPTPGGPFSTIQAAINSISGQGPQNQYTVYAGPGTYNESITLAPWIVVSGSGSDQTKVTGIVNAASNASLNSMTIAPPTAVSYAISAVAVTKFGILSCAIVCVTVEGALPNGMLIDGRRGDASATLDNTTFSLNGPSPAADYAIAIGAIGSAIVVMTSGSVTSQMAAKRDTAVQTASASISLRYLTVSSSNLALSTDARGHIYIAGCTITGKTTGNIHEV